MGGGEDEETPVAASSKFPGLSMPRGFCVSDVLGLTVCQVASPDRGLRWSSSYSHLATKTCTAKHSVGSRWMLKISSKMISARPRFASKFFSPT